MKKKQLFTFPEFVLGILSEDKSKLEYVYPLKHDSDAKAYAEATLIAKKHLDERDLFDLNYCVMLNNHDDMELEEIYLFYETLRIDEDGGFEVSATVHERRAILSAFDFANNAKGKQLSPAPRFCTLAELEKELAYTMG